MTTEPNATTISSSPYVMITARARFKRSLTSQSTTGLRM